MAGPTHTLAGFFTEDVSAVLAAIEAMESGTEAGQTFGAVTTPYTFRRERGSDRLLFEPRGLFSEVTFGPARDFICSCGAVAGADRSGTVCERCGVVCGPSSLRAERYGHIEVQQVVHPAAYSALITALGWYGIDIGGVAVGDIYIRGGRQIHHLHSEEGDVTGAPAIAAALRALDPQHPLLPLCSIRRIPVPPPEARPFVRGLAPTMIDPWIGPINQAWLGLIERANRERTLVGLSAPAHILENEALAVQRAFKEVIEASKPALPLMPPLVYAPEDLSDDDALGLAFIDAGSLLVQRADATYVITDAGALVRALPPAGCKLVGVLRGRIAVFEELFMATDPYMMSDIGPWGGFVREGEEGVRQMAPHIGGMSALDCETGEFLVDVPPGVPRGVVVKDQPEDLFFTDPATGRTFRLHVGGDRPNVLAFTRDLELAWIGEDKDTQVIEMARGISHVVPAHPGEAPATLDLDAGDGDLDAGADEDEDEYENEDGEGYGCAITFRGGRFFFLWEHGVVADHRGEDAFQILPEPRAGAFDPSGERLAVVVGSEIVLIDIDRRAVIRRFPLPVRNAGSQ